MPTVHELLVSKVKADVKVASAAPQAVSKKEPVMIDDAGLDKLAQALEAIVAGSFDAKTVKTILTKTAHVLRQVKAQRSYLIDEVAQTEHTKAASALASELVRRGVYTEKDLGDLVQKVAKLNNLDAVKQAAELFQPAAKKELPIGTVEKAAAPGSALNGWLQAHDWLVEKV